MKANHLEDYGIYMALKKHLFEVGIRFEKGEHLAGKRILVMLPEGNYYMENDNSQVKTWGNCGEVAKSLKVNVQKIVHCLTDTKEKRVHYCGIQLRYTENNSEPTEPFVNVEDLVYRQCRACSKPGHIYPAKCEKAK